MVKCQHSIAHQQRIMDMDICDIEQGIVEESVENDYDCDCDDYSDLNMHSSPNADDDSCYSSNACPIMESIRKMKYHEWYFIQQKERQEELTCLYLGRVVEPNDRLGIAVMVYRPNKIPVLDIIYDEPCTIQCIRPAQHAP